MKLIHGTAIVCLLLACIAILASLMTQEPEPLLAVPALLLVGLGFVAANRALELLTEIRDALVAPKTDGKADG